jgi:glucokinase
VNENISLSQLIVIMNLQLLIPIAFRNGDPSGQINEIILAGDIGGTKANISLSRLTDAGAETIKEARFASKDFTSFSDILTHFLEGQPRPGKICLSVAGPVIEGKVKFTNLSWQIDSAGISEQMGGCPITILNDLEATAYGLAAMKKEDLSLLHQGTNETPGNIAILAAGTGLGEAGLFFDGQLYHPFATEGGHSDFAPRTQQDITLFTFLQRRHQHVSWERVLSGNGIYTIWEFLTTVEKKESPDWLLLAMKNNDPARIISNAAKDGSCPVCAETITIFNRYLAIEAVNLILKYKATGGLYLAGGIAPKLLSLLDPAVWTEVFNTSGRMKQLLEEVTVQVMLNEKAPLMGAAYYAWLNM